jgi:hypothetical protein
MFFIITGAPMTTGMGTFVATQTGDAFGYKKSRRNAR